MITSIRIKNGDTLSDPITGSILIEGSDYLSVGSSNNKLQIDASRLDVFKVNTPRRCPYISSVSSVSPDGFGNVYLLGGTTSQVDYTDSELLLCDMSQRNDSPIIFRAIYDMLRILRRWLDGHKDSLLLAAGPGEDQWSKMQDDDITEDYYLSKPIEDRPEFPLPIGNDMILDDRKRSEILSIGPARRLYNEYQAVVALWNRIVKEPETVTEVRVHPGDNAGVYIGVTANIPLTNVASDSVVKITTTISVTFSGQSGSNLLMWNRVLDPYCRVFPRPSTRNYSITFPGSYVSGVTEGSRGSKLDREGKVTGSEGELTAVYEEIITGSSTSPLASVYTAQMLYEVIPFCVCSTKDSAGKVYTERSYADSLFGLHYVQQDENTWEIHILSQYSVGDDPAIDIVNKTLTKKTIYAKVCKDPYKDLYPEDAEEEEESESAQ